MGNIINIWEIYGSQKKWYVKNILSVLLQGCVSRPRFLFQPVFKSVCWIFSGSSLYRPQKTGAFVDVHDILRERNDQTAFCAVCHPKSNDYWFSVTPSDSFWIHT